MFILLSQNHSSDLQFLQFKRSFTEILQFTVGKSQQFKSVCFFSTALQIEYVIKLFAFLQMWLKNDN